MSQRQGQHKPRKIIKTQSSRLPRIDRLRGYAVIAMIAYHFCYDLVYFQWVYFDFQQGLFWQTSRFLIVSVFLLLVGVSLQLSTRGEKHLKTKHWNRLVIIGAAAILVSLGSFLLFDARFIFFGILHLIVVASLIGLWLRQYMWVNFILATICLLFGFFFEHPIFNHSALQWLGMMTYAPATEDYVPLLPWLGMVLLGSALGARLLQSDKKAKAMQRYLGQTAGNRITQIVEKIGQQALPIYLLHQPLLIASIYLIIIY